MPLANYASAGLQVTAVTSHPPGSGKKKLSTGAIIGIAVGAFGGVLLIVILVVYIITKGKSSAAVAPAPAAPIAA